MSAVSAAELEATITITADRVFVPAGPVRKVKPKGLSFLVYHFEHTEARAVSRDLAVAKDLAVAVEIAKTLAPSRNGHVGVIAHYKLGRRQSESVALFSAWRDGWRERDPFEEWRKHLEQQAWNIRERDWIRVNFADLPGDRFRMFFTDAEIQAALKAGDFERAFARGCMVAAMAESEVAA